MTATPGTPDDWTDTNPESTAPERILPTPEDVTPSATKVAMVCYAVGAASKCWEHPERAGVFDSDRASQIVTELCVALGMEQQGDTAPESAVAVDGTVLVEVGDFCDAEFIAASRDVVTHLLALVESLTAERDALVTTVGRVQALVDSNPDHADTCGSVLTPGAGYPCSCWQADLRAALATTGEDQ